MRHLRSLSLLLWLCVVTAAGQPVCSVERYDEDSGMSQWHVTQMLQDADGLMWFSTWNGLDRFDGLTFTNFKSRPGDGCAMPTDRIRDLRQTADGELFCLAEKDWYHFHRHTGTFSPATATQAAWLNKGTNGRQATGTAHRRVEHRDRHGRQWMIDEQGRLFYHEGDAWREYALTEPLAGAQFFMPDRQGNLWLLMKNSVVRLSFAERPVAEFPQERPAQVRCIFTDNTGRYWICTRDDATVRLFTADNRLLGYLTAQGTLSPRYASFGSPVYCMTQTSDGTLWMGSKPDGLFALTPRAGGFAVSHLKGLLPCDDIYHLLEDRHHRLWAATMGGGLCCIEQPLSSRPRVVSARNGFAHYPSSRENRVRYLHITPSGVLMAATTEGLLVGQIPDGDVAQMRFRLHQREAGRANSLGANATMDIVETADHRIFVSTESGGISEIITPDLLAGELRFRHHNRQTGLDSDIALSMTEHDGRLWIVGSNQLMAMRTDGEQADVFGRHFFHGARRFSEAHPVRLPDGRWLFGLMDGAFSLSDSILRKSTYVPAIALTSVDKLGKGPDHAVNHLSHLTLGPAERSLTITFAALDYENPSAVSYAFRMDGDPEWNYIGHNRSASFAGLAPGTYTLLLRSTNGDGVWVDNVRRLVITVEPTFWESWTGKLLLMVLIAAIMGAAVYTYYYIRTMKRRHHETLEAYLALVAQHTPTANAPHETPTPPAAATPPPAPPAVTKPALKADEEAFMARVMAYVEQHIDDTEANIGDMADAAATSRSGLNRKMKSLVGLTPADFLREARIKRACLLLASTDDTVADVAFRCGFTDPKYFGKCFKTSTGMSPTEYRSSATGL